MPATRSSVLDTKPATELRPGETGLRLKDDPYYGKVDLGPAPDSGDDKDAKFEKKERAHISQLPAPERPAAEEKLGRELAKRKAAKPKPTPYAADDPRGSVPAAGSRTDQNIALGFLEESIESGVHALDGDEQSHVEVLTGKRLQQRAPVEDPRPPEEVGEGEGEEELPPARAGGLEPPERDRDKTPARKPGESAKP